MTLAPDPGLDAFHLAGDPDDIRRSAAAYARAGRAARGIAAALRGAVAPADWVGADADLYAARLALLAPVLDEADAACHAVASALSGFAAALEAAQGRMRSLAHEARVVAAEAALDPAAAVGAVGVAGAVGAVGAAGPASGTRSADLTARAEGVAADVRAAAARCRRLVEAHARPPRVPAAVHTGRAAGLRDLVPGPAPDPTPGPAPAGDPPPADPAGVRRWWTGLPPARRAALLAAEPARWGHLPGVPSADRSSANRITLDRELAAGRAWFAARGRPAPTGPDDVAALETDPPGRPGPERDAALARFRGALAVEAALARSEADVDPAERGADRPYLLTYEPAAHEGRGRTQISIGDPETAAALAVLVPGMRSATATIGGDVGGARRLRRAATRGHPGSSTAVVVSQTYDAPQTLARAARQDHAARGARDVARDVAALRAARRGRGPLTVVGHSYGSTTLGLALQDEGLAASVDRVALVGSPGVGGGARSARDLHLRDDQLFVGSASTDLVTRLPEGLGRNPAGPGAWGTRFRAENGATRATRGWTEADAFDDHTAYYTDGSESLEALGRIVGGHPEELRPAGLVAEPRHVEGRAGHALTVDPERSRAPAVFPSSERAHP